MKKEIIEFAASLDAFEKLTQQDTQIKKEMTAARQRLQSAKRGLHDLESDLLEIR